MASYDETLRALATHQRLRLTQIRQFSGLASEQLRQLKAVWSTLPDPERMHLLALLRKTAEENSLMDFDPVFSMAMDDSNGDVRRLAVAGALDSENPRMLEKLLRLCADDTEEMVRAAAAERLAGFAYEAEVGTLPEEEARRIEEVLLVTAQSETEALPVRAAALASVGYFSTEAVRDAINRALTRSGLLLSALRAIGRNADPIWTPVLIEHMGDDDPAIRREAAEAAADYEDTVPALSDLVDDPDISVRLAAISSLGSIGGPEARDILVYCYESADPRIREAAASALQEIEETEDPLGSLGADSFEPEEQ